MLVISLLLVLGGLGLVKGNFWTVRGIRCSLNGQICSAQLWGDLMRLSLGKDFIFFPKSTIIQQINSEHPEIDKIEAVRVLPWVLAFKLTVSQAQAVVKGEKYFLVNIEGVVLKISDRPGDLPVILMDLVKNVGVGEKFDRKEVVLTIGILSDLGTRELHPTMAKIISPQQVNIWLNNGTLVAVSLKKEANIQLDSLQVILSRVKIEGKALGKIDLRFDKPVITYE